MSNVRYETFVSWGLLELFDVDILEHDGRRTISKIYCKVCRKYLDRARKDVRLRGQAKTNCLQYAVGSSNVVKCRVVGHLKSLVGI